MVLISQVWPSCWLWGILILVGCVLSQLNPSGFSIVSCENCLGLRPRSFFTAKNGELFGLYPIRKTYTVPLSCVGPLRWENVMKMKLSNFNIWVKVDPCDLWHLYDLEVSSRRPSLGCYALSHFSERGYQILINTRGVLTPPPPSHYLTLSALGPSSYVRIRRLHICRRQNMTYKDGPRAERTKIFIMAVYP